jgi:cyanophycinase
MPAQRIDWVRRVEIFGILVFVAGLLASPAGAGSRRYQYIRTGNAADSTATPRFGVAMMGGGTDLDDAFRWLCDLGNGGDFLILRAHGGDDYNSYVAKLCNANSVATLIIPSRAAAQDPAVAAIIQKAEVVFIAGGDQARYVRYWGGTSVIDALNAGIAAGKPIGGTSAGLAVEGEFVFSALHDTSYSKDALRNPHHRGVTLERDYLKIALLDRTITDSHFAKRDRMGRTLVFLARLIQDGWAKEPRSIAIDEKSAVLVESDGNARVVGNGLAAYFIRPEQAPKLCARKKPLTLQNISVYRAPSGARFNLKSWTGDGGAAYTLSVDAGVIHSTQSGGAIY